MTIKILIVLDVIAFLTWFFPRLDVVSISLIQRLRRERVIRNGKEKSANAMVGRCVYY